MEVEYTEVDFNYPFRIFPITDRPSNLYVFIMVGLPGIGKTTFAEYIKESCPAGQAVIISRDEMRDKELWESRKLPPDEQKVIRSTLDFKVTLDCLDQYEEELTVQRHRVIIFDGCHTNHKDLVELLLYIREAAEDRFKGNLFISLVMIGLPDSKTNIRLNNTRPEDYVDYKNRRGIHDSVPKKVFLTKKAQFRELLKTKNLDKVLRICDFAFRITPVLARAPYFFTVK